MIISHDSGFLDAVCSNIIHYHKKQLHYYRGNLHDFVEKYPPGRTYYTLSDEVVKGEETRDVQSWSQATDWTSKWLVGSSRRRR